MSDKTNKEYTPVEVCRELAKTINYLVERELKKNTEEGYDVPGASMAQSELEPAKNLKGPSYVIKLACKSCGTEHAKGKHTKEYKKGEDYIDVNNPSDREKRLKGIGHATPNPIPESKKIKPARHADGGNDGGSVRKGGSMIPGLKGKDSNPLTAGEQMDQITDKNSGKAAPSEQSTKSTKGGALMANGKTFGKADVPMAKPPAGGTGLTPKPPSMAKPAAPAGGMPKPAGMGGGMPKPPMIAKGMSDSSRSHNSTGSKLPMAPKNSIGSVQPMGEAEMSMTKTGMSDSSRSHNSTGSKLPMAPKNSTGSVQPMGEAEKPVGKPMDKTFAIGGARMQNKPVEQPKSSINTMQKAVLPPSTRPPQGSATAAAHNDSFKAAQAAPSAAIPAKTIKIPGRANDLASFTPAGKFGGAGASLPGAAPAAPKRQVTLPGKPAPASAGLVAPPPAVRPPVAPAAQPIAAAPAKPRIPLTQRYPGAFGKSESPLGSCAICRNAEHPGNCTQS